jgi:hypothetical protein
MYSPRHARPAARRPLAAAAGVAVAAAAVAAPLSAQAAPSAPVADLLDAGTVAGLHARHVTQAPVHAGIVHRAVPPAEVLVRPGDTLWGIAGRVCDDPGDDLALAYNNGVTDPNLIYAGQLFKVACQAAAQQLAARYPAPAATPPPRPLAATAPPPAVQQPSSVGASGSGSNDSGPSVGSPEGYSGSSSMQSCIIAAESGGSSQVMNSTGHYGLYQFSEQTWAAHGGNPADFGNASVAEQNQVYYNTVAADGYSDWAPYDGCTP